MTGNAKIHTRAGALGFSLWKQAPRQYFAIDGGSGEVENTAVLTAHLVVGGTTIDVPMRWRGQGGFPASEYSRQPSEMWTGVWNVPADAPIGTIKYTVTATDRFARTATFSPFINVVSQLAIVE